MLVLTRKVGARVVIGDSVEVVVLANQRGIVRIGIRAPRSVSILREELTTHENAPDLDGNGDDRERVPQAGALVRHPEPTA